MFGIIKGNGLNRCHRQIWQSHVCGVCMALNRNYGYSALIMLNTDCVMLSLLCEAQAGHEFNRIVHRCPLARFRKMPAVLPDHPATQYAAAICILTGSLKMLDHIRDQDTWICRFPETLQRFARKRLHAVHERLNGSGFEPGRIERAFDRQCRLEKKPNRSFAYYASPSEQSTAYACGHTAVISGHPENGSILFHAGRMFGRIVYLLDSYLDYDLDTARHHFNALAWLPSPEHVKTSAQQMFSEACFKLKKDIEQLKLSASLPVNELLICQLNTVGAKVLGTFPGTQPLPENDPDFIPNKPGKQNTKKRGHWSDWCIGCTPDFICKSNGNDCGCDGCGDCTPGCCDGS